MSEQDKLTDEAVRDTFQWGATACACCAEYRDEDGVKFDAWLAEHDAKVRAEALRDAATWVEDLAVHDGLMYREFDDGEEVAESIPTALRVRADRIEREAGLK